MFTILTKSRNKKGFTLIEVMVVVALIAILSAIAIPAYLSYRRDAEMEVARSSMVTIIDSVNGYNAIKGHAMDIVDGSGNIVGTVQDVIDKFAAEGMTVVVDAIKLDANMADYCVYNDGMQCFVLRDDVSADAWAELCLNY